MNLQEMFDAMSAAWMRERAETQMTLGKLIAALEAMQADADIAGLVDPHSYRGYYSDLAFVPVEGVVKAGELLQSCKAAMGREFIGYKGGEFLMGENTPVWVAHYGSCGLRLMAINSDGSLETEEEED